MSLNLGMYFYFYSSDPSSIIVVITRPQDRAAKVARPTSMRASSARMAPMPQSEKALPNGLGKNLSNNFTSLNLAMSGVGNSALSTYSFILGATSASKILRSQARYLFSSGVNNSENFQ